MQNPRLLQAPYAEEGSMLMVAGQWRRSVGRLGTFRKEGYDLCYETGFSIRRRRIRQNIASLILGIGGCSETRI